MNQVYKSVGVKKQAFYQMMNRRDFTREETAQLVYMVHQVRRDHPRMSVREIYFKLPPLSIGRDKFEQICFDNGLRVKKNKNYRKTTDSSGVVRFPNLLSTKKVTGVNQVFVSDITYFEIAGKFYYITLIMDLFNREIVGYFASDSLRTNQTTIPAMHRVIRERGRVNLKGAIIHSDGGGQYYCKDFNKLTNKLRMRSSMTEESVYENSHAERLNGIIKNDYLYPYAPDSLQSLRTKLKKAVRMYNEGKPHSALDRKTPVQYRMQGSIENENNAKRNYPFSTEKHKQHKSESLTKKTVNVI